jgi:hypothetical protein
MAQQGIIFDLQSNLLPTQIPPPLITLEASAAPDEDDANVISLSFTFKIKNATIGERPAQLDRKGFLPFEEGKTVIQFAKFDQAQTEKQLKRDGDDGSAEFSISVDWPGGKIGGAEFRLKEKEAEQESINN